MDNIRLDCCLEQMYQVYIGWDLLNQEGKKTPVGTLLRLVLLLQTLRHSRNLGGKDLSEPSDQDFHSMSLLDMVSNPRCA